MFTGRFPPYVPVGERRARAALEMMKRRRRGESVSPVTIEGRTIAATFWGKAWCENLERYSDYENRLPRGRSYVRNGSVVDLQLARGKVVAVVSGSELYDVKIAVEPVAAARWRALRADCAGGIDSLVELLQGRLADRTMQRMCAPRTGLFPEPRELSFACSCPDVAAMCKHIAAVLYGVGARLDHEPALLFTLRGVDPAELVAGAGEDLAKKARGRATRKVLATTDLSALFGIEIAEAPAPAPPRGRKRAKRGRRRPKGRGARSTATRSRADRA